MRILYIACENANCPSIGGSLVRLKEISQRLKGNFDIYCLTSSGGGEALKDVFHYDKIFSIKSYIFSTKVERKFGLVEWMISYMIIVFRSFSTMKNLPEFDIIYTSSDGFWNVIPAFFYKRRYPQVKWISMHHHQVSLNKETIYSLIISLVYILIQRFSYFFIKKYTEGVCVLATSMGDTIKGIFLHRGYKGKLFSVKNGIDFELIKAVPKQEKLYDACFLGGLRPSKGLYDIVPIWKKVCLVKKKARLVIIGGTLERYRRYLEEKIRVAGLEKNIVVAGHVGKHRDVIRLLKQSKIFISPSHEEGWGMAIMESLASGIPGILWNLSVYRGIFNRGVVKTPLFNIRMFVGNIISLLDNKDIYDKLTEGLEKAYKKYDWGQIAREEIDLFLNFK